MSGESIPGEKKMTPVALEVELLLEELEPAGLVRMIGCDPDGAQRWTITARGRRWLAEGVDPTDEALKDSAARLEAERRGAP